MRMCETALFLLPVWNMTVGTVNMVNMVNMVIVPNFVAIGQTVAETLRFFDFSKTAAVRHLGFVMHIFRPPTKGIWWSLSLCKIWLESLQKFRWYASFNILQVRLENAYSRPPIFFLGGGQNSGRGDAMLTPNELALTLRVLTSVPLLAKIDQEIRPWECEQTDGHTHW